MPTSTRRQAHTRPLARSSDQPTIEVPSDGLAPQADAFVEDVMEYEDQIGDEDEVEEGRLDFEYLAMARSS